MSETIHIKELDDNFDELHTAVEAPAQTSEHQEHHNDHVEVHETAQDQMEQRIEVSVESKKSHAETSQEEHETEEVGPHVAATTKEDINKIFAVADESQPLPPAGKQLKSVNTATNLSVIRGRLKKPEQTFSKLVHQPLVNALSEVTGKTFLRPAAILTGSVVTLLGSAYYLFVTHQTGYKYNFFVALVLYAGGFALGLLFELLYRMIQKLSFS